MGKGIPQVPRTSSSQTHPLCYPSCPLAWGPNGTRDKRTEIIPNNKQDSSLCSLHCPTQAEHWPGLQALTHSLPSGLQDDLELRGKGMTVAKDQQFPGYSRGQKRQDLSKLQKA